MNRRQAKKKLKKEYNIVTPRQAIPRLTKKYWFWAVEKYKNKIAEYIDNLIIKGEIKE
jgi:hypothetical protein